MVTDLLDAHLLASEHLADIDLAAAIADATAGGDHGRPVVKRVLQLLEPLVEAGGRHIHRRGGLHVERLMRPLVAAARRYSDARRCQSALAAGAHSPPPAASPRFS